MKKTENNVIFIVSGIMAVLMTATSAYAFRDLSNEIRAKTQDSAHYIIFKLRNDELVAPGFGPYRSFTISQSAMMLRRDGDSWLFDTVKKDGYREAFVLVDENGQHIDFDENAYVEAAFLHKRTKMLTIYAREGSGHFACRRVFSYNPKMNAFVEVEYYTVNAG